MDVSIETSNGVSFEGLSKYEAVTEKPATSFYHNWGHQAWLDLALLRWLLKSTGHIVEHTWVPIIKLSADDRKSVDEAFARVRSFNEKVSLFDSPREKWRKEYGCFIREIEWACDELYKIFPKKEYQELVQATVGDAVAKWLEGMIPMINKYFADDPEKGPLISRMPLKAETMEKMTIKFFNKINFASFMVDESYVESFNVNKREMVIKMPDCGFHNAPRMKTIPDQGCVHGCKGGCERALNEETPLKVLFEPHLPDTSCTLTITW